MLKHEKFDLVLHILLEPIYRLHLHDIFKIKVKFTIAVT